jgi:PAS domain-containing protein
MSRLGTHSVGRLLRGELASSTDEVGSAEGRAVLKWLGLGGAVLVACIAAGVAIATLSVRECVLLAAVAVLALSIGLLLKRDQWFHRTLAAERRHLRTAVNNIPQGLVLYDASARIVVCNQPYIDMFGLSADVAKQGCTMQRLIAHRQETGSFDGDVDAFCTAIIRNVRLGKATRQMTEAPGGRAIEIATSRCRRAVGSPPSRTSPRASAPRRRSPISPITMGLPTCQTACCSARSWSGR